MKRVILILAAMLTPVLVSGQDYIDVDFGDGVPPDNWTIDAHSANWSSNDGNEAGGTAPEAIMSWTPQFSDTSRLISPDIDLTGISAVCLVFKHFVDDYRGSSYTVGAATRNGTNDWNTVWSVTPTDNVGPDSVNIIINNSDVGADDFQFCLYFGGTSMNLDYWYIDDIKLFALMEHDLKVGDVPISGNYQAGEQITPTAELINYGTSDETTGEISYIVDINGTVVYNETISSLSIASGEAIDVEFPVFTIPTANEMYDVIVIAHLDTDMYNGNDTATTEFTTYATPRDMVVMEVCTATWCTYCPGAAMGAEDLVDNGYNAAVIEYHSNSNDVYGNSYAVTRFNYYDLEGYPTAYFDGILSFVGGDHTESMYSYYVPLVEERQPIYSPFAIAINGSSTGDDYSLTVTVDQVSRNNYNNLKLHVVLTESDIECSWQDQDHLMWVERTMLPNASGSTIDFSSGDIQTFDLAFTMDTDWVAENCELVAFIQTNDTKEILQGTKIDLSALVPVSINDDNDALPLATSLKGNYPNPFNPSTTIEFYLMESAYVTLDVYNVMGQKVTALINSRMEAGYHSVAWDGKDNGGNSVASGAYFYKLSADDYSSVKKMLLIK